MARKKRQFHCGHCGSPCEIYKKGRRHRVLVCPHCGVIATNPISLRGVLGSVAGSIPLIGGVAQYAIENIGGRKTDSIKSTPSATPSISRLSTFQKAIALEALEK